MGYYSEQHLLYGKGASKPTVSLPGSVEQGDNRARLVITQGGATVYRYFATDGEARRAGKVLRHRLIVFSVQYLHAREGWI